MAIYLSSAQADDSDAAALVEGLHALGWEKVITLGNEVREGGAHWGERVACIHRADLMLLLWSRHSESDRWTGRELDEARRCGLPTALVRLDETPVTGDLYHPLTFDLKGWSRECASGPWQRFIAGLARATGNAWLKQTLRILNDPRQSSQERRRRGELLGRAGDPRPGIGLNSDGLPDIDWVDIPAGDLLLGKRRHSIAAFQISRYPITRLQFRAFVEQGGYRPEQHSSDRANRWWAPLNRRFSEPPSRFFEPPVNLPYTRLAWFEAMAFCSWLAESTGRPIRLPNEAQWIRAARASSSNLYVWGDESRGDEANLADSPSLFSPPQPGTLTSVGLYPKDTSPFGVRDLAGNVQEWCINEAGSPFSQVWREFQPRAYKGGSYATGRWGALIEVPRSTLRSERAASPDLRSPTLGFRIITKSQRRA